MQAETMHAGPMVGIAGAMEMEGKVPASKAFFLKALEPLGSVEKGAAMSPA
jgi:hypothetical protein